MEKITFYEKFLETKKNLKPIFDTPSVIVSLFIRNDKNESNKPKILKSVKIRVIRVIRVSIMHNVS